MGEESIGKLLLRFSLPAIVGMLVIALYNVVDRIFLGMVSNEAIAAVYVTFPIALIIMAVDMGIGQGGASLASIRLGQRRQSEADRILSNAFVMMLVVSIALSLVMYIGLFPMLKIFGATPSLIHIAAEYERIIILGIPVQMLGFGLNNFIRAEGNPKIAMFTMLIGAITNTILDYIFILQFGWGVKGAAIATITGQALSFIWVFFYFLNGKSLLRFRRYDFMPDFAIMRQIFVLGLPSFGMQLAASLVITICNHEISLYGGDLGLAAMGIVQSVSTMALLPIFGINQGVQPIIGYNYGALKFDRVREVLKKGIFVGMIFMTTVFVIIMCFPDQILSVFVSDPESYERIYPLAHEGLRLSYLSFPVLAYPIVGSTYFQATGKPIIAVITSLLRQLILLIPILHILAIYWNMTGIWLAYPISDVLSGIITGFFLIRAMRELRLSPEEWLHQYGDVAVGQKIKNQKKNMA